MSKLLSHERSNYISNSEIPIAGTTGECMVNQGVSQSKIEGGGGGGLRGSHQYTTP